MQLYQIHIRCNHHDTNLLRAIILFEEAWGGVETDSPWLDVVWGVDGLDRAASDPNDPFDEGGAPMYSSPFEPSSAEAQLAVLRVCEGGAAVEWRRCGRRSLLVSHEGRNPRRVCWLGRRDSERVAWSGCRIPLSTPLEGVLDHISNGYYLVRPWGCPGTRCGGCG